MLKEKVQRLMDETVAAGDNAGCSFLVYQNGEEVLYCESGFADLEKGKPIARDSMFQIFSMTKPITAVAVMKLVEEGKLSMLEPVSTYLPGFVNQKVYQDGRLVPTDRLVFIKDLLNMTSGMVYPEASVPGYAVDQVFHKIEEEGLSTLEAANALGRCPLAFQPGQGWKYGTGADILGAVVEVVTGMRYSDYLKQKIFGPLGMRDTDFYVPEEKSHRLVKTYIWHGKEPFTQMTTGFLAISPTMDKRPAFESGGAGLVSTIDDYSRFARMLLQDGELDGVRILQKRTVEYLKTGGVTQIQQKDFEKQRNDFSGYSYSNLMRVCKDPGAAYYFVPEGEFGWDGAKETFSSIAPKDNMVMVYMVQKWGGGFADLPHKLNNLVRAELC